MKTQEEKNVNVQENAKPAKRVLTADTLCHQPGMAVQTGVKAGGRLNNPPPPKKK
jgi:hypothetical protein